MTPAINGGTCGPTSEEVPCNTQPCPPTNCVLGPWTDSTSCSKLCNSGTKIQTRTTMTPAINGGTCGPTSEEVPCNTQPCPPTNCVLGPWTDSTSCSKLCNSGTKIQTRTTMTPAINGGTCGPTSEEVPCNTQSCPPTNCVLGPWTDSTSCSKLCNSGTKIQTRTTMTPAINGGTCGPTSEEVPCNTQPCPPTNCVLGPWTDSTSCSKSCNSGTKIQTRTTMTPAINGGTCGPTSEEVPCNTQPCPPTNCVLGPWTDSTSCSKSCNSGTKIQTRTTMTPAINGGTCGPTSEEVPCNTQPCPPTNCVLGPWTDSTSCSKLCNSGTKIQTRTTMTPAINGGTCGPTSEEVPCNTQPCPPTNCVLGPWTDSTSCSKSCNSGTKIQTRTTMTPAINGGTCGPTSEEVPCNTQPCPPTNCVLGPWTDSTSCSKSCNSGTKIQTRTTMTPAINGGTCGPTSEEVPCNTQPCPPTNCVLGPWTDSTGCSKLCNSGTKIQTRTTITPAINGGTCGPTSEEVPCKYQSCPNPPNPPNPPNTQNPPCTMSSGKIASKIVTPCDAACNHKSTPNYPAGFVTYLNYLDSIPNGQPCTSSTTLGTYPCNGDNHVKLIVNINYLLFFEKKSVN